MRKISDQNKKSFNFRGAKSYDPAGLVDVKSKKAVDSHRVKYSQKNFGNSPRSSNKNGANLNLNIVRVKKSSLGKKTIPINPTRLKSERAKSICKVSGNFSK